MFQDLCRKVQLPILLTAILLTFISIPVSAQNNCGGNLNSVNNHDASWSGWDNLINRLQSRGCDYVDIDLDMLATATEVSFGDTFDYVINVRNVGTASAPQVDFSLPLPGEVKFSNFSVDFGSVGSGGCSGSSVNNHVSCDLVDMPAGTGMVITINVEVTIVRSFSATVTLDEAPGDLDPRNNSATVFTN